MGRFRDVRPRAAVAVVLMAGGLVAGALAGAGRGQAVAQDAPAAPPRPSHIHEGDCDEPGAIVQPLSALTAPGTEVLGNDEAVVAEAAFTNIPLSLDAMVAEDHSVKVHLSRDQIQIYLACGDIGGTLDADGALIVGLKEQDGSGYTGIAYLRPLPNGTTDTSVIIAKVLPGEDAAGAAPAGADDAADGGDDAAGAGAGAGAGAEVVEVELTEFSIEMPTDLPAGPVRFDVSNVGAVPHNFVVEGDGGEGRLEARLAPGATATLEMDLAPGSYVAYCPVGNGAHRGNGMEVELTVV